MADMVPSYAVETRMLLEECDLSDAQVADEIGVSTATVYRWRQGQSVPPFGRSKAVAELIKERVRVQMEKVRRLESDLDKHFCEPETNGRPRVDATELGSQ